MTMLMAAAIMLCACEKEERQASVRPETVTVNVSLSGIRPMTKASFDSDDNMKEAEASIKSVQFFAFNAEGKYEANYIGTEKDFALILSAGKKDFVALVNCPAISFDENTTEASILALASSYSDNSLGNLQMTGTLDGQEVNSNTLTLNVTVERIVAKVIIKKMTNLMKLPVHQGKSFTVDAIYMTNVCGTNTFGGATVKTAADWFNKLKYTSSKMDAMLYDGDLGISIPYNTSFDDKEFDYYPYPNGKWSSFIYDDTWSERQTRLVIEATFDGKKCYYPIDFDTIDRNRRYTFEEIIFTKPGVDDPWDPFDSEACGITLSVADWEDALNTIVTF